MTSTQAEGDDQAMRIAGIWRRGPAGLELKPELGRSTDPEEEEALLRFLRGGSVVIRSPGLREDRLDPSREPAVPYGYLTDGSWIWPMELAYYLEQHGVLPQDEFLEHIRASDFTAVEPDTAVAEAAYRVLKGDQA